MRHRLDQVVDQISTVILGKQETLRLAMACLFANGHLLIEDLPGVGKTLLAQLLAKTLGLDFNRIQFTSDMLPADILGASIYDRENGSFRFQPGPIFAQVVVADEINRATPKTQSALLEAMEERQVTSDGVSRPLPTPFFVVATQNPSSQLGTFPLPESQLDRFLMRVRLGYPDQRAERELLSGPDRRGLLAGLTTCLAADELRLIQEEVPSIHLSQPLLDYVQALLGQTRRAPDLRRGLSPRAGVALVRAAQSWAVLQGRDHARPEDVQAVFPSVAGHRLSALGGQDDGSLLQRLLEAVPIP